MQSDIADQKERLQALDPLHSFIVQAPAGSGKTGLLTQRFLVLLAMVDEPEEIIAITFTRKAASEMRQRITQALQGASRDPAPDDVHQRHTWELARRALVRDQLQDWQLLGNPSRLRILTIDSLCAQLVGQMPVCSKQGALSDITDHADVLYLEAARLTILALEDDTEWTVAIAHLIRHLDNRLDKLQRLIADMLAQRDQWMRHVFDHGSSASPAIHGGVAETKPRPGAASPAQTCGEEAPPLQGGVTHNSNPDQLRVHLESALTNQVTAVLRALHACVPGACQGEIIALARYAANQLPAEASNNKISHCRSMQEWPGWQESDRLFWEGIAELLLTQGGDWRKQVTKRIGFPAPTSVRDAVLKESLAEMKQRMLDLLARMQEQELFRRQLLKLRQLPPNQYEDEEWKTLQALFKLLKMAVGYLALVFQQSGQVDFAEISMAAIHALGEPEMPTDLALALDYRIHHLLVDEFQDTSLNQAELLIRLTAGWQSGDGRTLFLVGDPMQSIYRFRQAEVGLFLDIWEKGFFGQIRMRAIQLSVNFRSQSGIVDWVNQYFPKIFPYVDDAAAGEVAFAYAKAFHAVSDNNAVMVYPFLQKNDLAEADQIVAIVHETQAIQPGGKIAILVRNRTHLTSIVIRLRQAGLRFQALEIERLAQRPVIQDLTALTRALLHPGDRIAWLAILRAPFCGLSLHDLHCIAGRDSEQAVIDLLHSNGSLACLSRDGQQRLERVLPILDCALSLRDKTSLRNGVEGVWIQLGGPASVANETDLADAEVFFQLLEKFDQAGYRLDVQELEEALAQLFALPDITADDTLQIMTLHKAKGLEFDTVILPGLGKRARRDQEKLLNWMECRTQAGSTDLMCAPISAQGGDRNPISAYVLSIEHNKAVGEDARLLYVAVTRAKHRLHLLGHISVKVETVENSKIVPAADTLLAKLWPAVASHFLARLRNPATLDMDQAEHYHSAERYAGRMRLAADWSPPDVPEVAEFLSVPASNLITESVDFDWAGDTARLVGLTVHRLLQHIGLLGIESVCEGDLIRYEQSGKLLLKQLGVAPQCLALAMRQVSMALKIMCVDDAVGRWILSGKHQDAHCEWALSTSIGESETSLNIIDRTFIDATGTRWIIDYKTGIHGGGEIDEFLYHEQQRYRPQLERYAAIVQKMENRRIRLGIYFPLLGEWREWLYQTA